MKAVLANGAREITGVNTADAASMLIGLLQNVNTLDSELTITVAFDLREEGLRAKVFIRIIDHRHISFLPYHYNMNQISINKECYEF